MRPAIGRISGALASVVALTIGVLGLIPVCPRWLWISLALAGLSLIVAQFVFERRSEERLYRGGIRQRQQGGARSQNLQAARDINYNGGSGVDKS